jgi:hypothetical protein
MYIFICNICRSGGKYGQQQSPGQRKIKINKNKIKNIGLAETTAVSGALVAVAMTEACLV